jgi:arabinogalactan endo-1,4-beta-galactosidase
MEKVLKTPVSDTSWGSWGKFEIKDIIVDDGKLVIGLEVKASAGNWGKIDDFELVKID